MSFNDPIAPEGEVFTPEVLARLLQSIELTTPSRGQGFMYSGCFLGRRLVFALAGLAEEGIWSVVDEKGTPWIYRGFRMHRATGYFVQKDREMAKAA